MATKKYSNKQERLIADYLGWEVVSGSGARDFNPGDIKSSQWLGECKTHVSIVDRITIKYSVWDKISTEAKSVFKFPALFIDNGSQNIDDTWVVYYYQKCRVSDILIPDYKLYGRVNCIFKHSELKVVYSSVQRGRDVPILCKLHMSDLTLGIMSLSNFCKLFGTK